MDIIAIFHFIGITFLASILFMTLKQSFLFRILNDWRFYDLNKKTSYIHECCQCGEQYKVKRSQGTSGHPEKCLMCSHKWFRIVGEE